MKISFVVFISFILNFNTSAQNIDINILKSLNVNRHQKLDKPMEFITDSVYPIGAAVPLGLIGIGLIKKDKILQRQGLVAGASLIVSLGTSYALKKIVNRPRPAITYPFIQPVVIENAPSFPSGHTTAAFSTATSLSLVYRKWYVVVPAYAWAGTVAYSRMHLGVHYPSDVLAGAIIGSGTAWLSYRVNHWLQKKK